jgi:hypothetical protein
MTSNLLTNGEFHAGNTGFTSGYAYEIFISSETEYTVTAADNINNVNAYGDWTSIDTDPKGGNGNVLVANGATTAGVPVWSETVAVHPDTSYVFTFYGVDVNAERVSDAVLSPIIDGTAGRSLDTDGSWQRRSFEWNSGAHTSATLRIVDLNTSGPYNDLAIDDLSFRKAGAVGENTFDAYSLLSANGGTPSSLDAHSATASAPIVAVGPVGHVG